MMRPFSTNFMFATTTIPFPSMANYHSGLLFNNNNVERGAYRKLEAADAIQEHVVRNAGNVFVTKVKWCKCVVSPFHEFLVFYVEERGTQRESVILVERDVDQDWELPTYLCEDSADEKAFHDEAITNDKHMLKTATPGSSSRATSETWTQPQRPRPRKFQYSSKSVSESSSLGKSRPSYDILAFTHSGSDKFVHRIEEQHELVLELNIHGEFFSVPQLVVLANLVHNHHSDYTLFEYQCYWYAAIIYSVVDRKCPGAVRHKGPAYEKRGKFVGRKPFRKGKAWSTDDFLKAFDEDHWPLYSRKIVEAKKRELVIRQEVVQNEVAALNEKEKLKTRQAMEEKQLAEERANNAETARKEAEVARRQAEEKARAYEIELEALRNLNLPTSR